MAEALSPCTGVCVLDEAAGLCRGCQRTVDEIAGWLSFDAATRKAVLRRVAERRKAMRAAPRRRDG